MRQDRYLDELLLLAIREIFPDHTVPDEENIRPDGSKYPAPDHYINEFNLFIERKSLNPEKKNTLGKVNSIRQQAGISGVRVYGRVSSRQLFQDAPEQTALIKKLNDYKTNQLRKVLRAVEKNSHLSCWKLE